MSENKSERIELEDITFTKVKNYIKDIWFKIFGYRIKVEDSVEFAEIVMYRSMACKECLLDGACLKSKGGCSCPTPNLFLAMDAECGRDVKKWESLDSKNWKKEWIEFKEKSGLSFMHIFSK